MPRKKKKHRKKSENRNISKTATPRLDLPPNGDPLSMTIAEAIKVTEMDENEGTTLPDNILMTEHSARAWCRISSYLNSMKAHGYNSHDAIRIAFDGNAADMIKKHEEAV